MLLETKVQHANRDAEAAKEVALKSERELSYQRLIVRQKEFKITELDRLVRKYEAEERKKLKKQRTVDDDMMTERGSKERLKLSPEPGLMKRF